LLCFGGEVELCFAPMGHRIPAWPVRRRFLRIGKVSVTPSDVRNEGKKSHFVHESEIPKHLSTESVQKTPITIPA